MPLTQSKLHIGVDVGGTKVAVLVARDGQEIIRKVNPTRLNSPEETLSGITDTIREAVSLAQAGWANIAAIGIGIPGRVDPENGTAHLAVNLNWKDVAAGPALEQALKVPCYVENDVRMAALGLKYHPHFQAVKNLAYLSIGTGIAAGLIIHGELYRGTHGMAGEIGHIQAVTGGPRCQCGAIGCLEAVASGPAIEQMMRDFQPSHSPNGESAASEISAGQIFYHAAQGDPATQKVVTKIGQYLGWAVKLLVLSYDIQLIVFGGGGARAGTCFLEPILQDIHQQRQESELAREMLHPEMIRLLPASFDAALWGGIALAEEGLQKKQRMLT